MRFAVALVAFSSALAGSFGSLAAATSNGGSLDALLARSRTASGAPYRVHVVSHSRETDNGHVFDLTTETEGLKYLARKCVRTLCVSGFYFDGERSFNTNFNDTALPLSQRVDGLQLTLRAIASYAFTAPEFRSDGGQIQDRDTVLRDGKTYRRIGVAPRLGALLDAVIDPDTGLVVGVISDARRLAFEFRDQRRVGNLMLPFSIALNGAEIEHFDGRTVDPHPLAAPPGLVPHISGTTSVAMTRADAPLVPCTIGTRRVICLFDTGNSGLAMSTELAAQLGLKAQTGGVLAGEGASVSGVAQAPALTVGGAVYPAAAYVVLGNMHAAGYDVVLGADAFAHTLVTLDFAKRIVALAASAGTGGPSGVALDFENFVPNVTATLGTATVPLAVDTGDASTLELAADYAAAHPQMASATSVRLGDASLERARIETTRRLGDGSSGVVGSGYFAHFTTVFDYARGRLSLIPRDGDPDARTIARERP